jgi:hypothetical protein
MTRVPVRNIPAREVTLAEGKKILWLDIEKRFADSAAAKVESYF